MVVDAAAFRLGGTVAVEVEEVKGSEGGALRLRVLVGGGGGGGERLVAIERSEG